MVEPHLPKTPDEVWTYVSTDEGEAIEVPPPAEEGAIHAVVPAVRDYEGLVEPESSAWHFFDDEEPASEVGLIQREDDEELEVSDLLEAQHYLDPKD